MTMTSTDPTAPITEYPAFDELRREHDGGVMVLTLDRPERNNAWTHALEDAYFGSLLAAGIGDTLRVFGCDVAHFKRVTGHVEELKFGVAVPRLAAERLKRSQFIRGRNRFTCGLSVR